MAFHTPEWTDAMCASGKWRDVSRFYETNGGRKLVLPLVQRRLAGGSWAEQASAPYGWGFGGLLAATYVTAEDLTLGVADLAASAAVRTCVRPNPLVHPAWPQTIRSRSLRVDRSAHALDLTGGWDTVWTSRFTGSARTAVRKAERQGLRVESDDNARLLPAFYQLYEQSILRWGDSRLGRWRSRRSDPLSKFRHVIERVGPMAKIWVAWHGDSPVASIVTLEWGDNVNYWRGAMDADLAGPTRANYLLHRLAIEEACVAGRTTYHMGETAPSSSLAQFKSRFGARPVDYVELRLERLPVTAIGARTRSLLGRGRP
jgi:hypothetical protein